MFLRAAQDLGEIKDEQLECGVSFTLSKRVYGDRAVRKLEEHIGLSEKFHNKPHGGRSAATTSLISQNVPGELITKQTRHKSPRTLKTYNRPHPVANSLVQDALQPKNIIGENVHHETEKDKNTSGLEDLMKEQLALQTKMLDLMLEDKEKQKSWWCTIL